MQVSDRKKIDDLKGTSPLRFSQNDEQGWFIDTEIKEQMLYKSTRGLCLDCNVN